MMAEKILNGIPASSSSVSMVLKPVVGEGREERLKIVEDIVRKNIAPLYDPQNEILAKVQNTDYRCRLLLDEISSAPLGVLVTDRRIHVDMKGLEECFEIRLFYAIEEDEQQAYKACLLEEAIEEAKGQRARSICIKVPNGAVGTLCFFKSKRFELIPQAEDPSMSLLGFILENVRKKSFVQSPRNSAPSSLSSVAIKRKREEEEKDTPKRVPVRIPIPGQEHLLESALKKRRVESLGRQDVPSQRTHGSPQTRRAGEKIDRAPIKKLYFEAIKRGSKTVEGRLDTGPFARWAEGQTIEFFNQDQSVQCTITKITKYSSFQAMLEEVGYNKCLPEVRSLEAAVEIYRNIPGYAQKESRFGVLAIHIQLSRA